MWFELFINLRQVSFKCIWKLNMSYDCNISNTYDISMRFWKFMLWWVQGDICLIFTKVWLWTLNNISENLWTCILTCCKFSEDLIVQSNTWMQTCGWRVHEIDPWWIGFVFNLNFHKSLRTPLKHFYSGFIKGIFLKKNLSFCN